MLLKMAAMSTQTKEVMRLIALACRVLFTVAKRRK
jgi:hypothetical protein